MGRRLIFWESDVKAKKKAFESFVVGKLRSMRPRRGNITEGAKTSVPLYTLFAQMKGSYSEQQIRDGLNALITEREILLIVKIQEVKVSGGTFLAFNSHVDGRLWSIPPAAPLHQHWWNLNEKGEPVKPGEDGHYKNFRNIRLYIIEDGLPWRVAHLLTGVEPKKLSGDESQ